MRGDKCGLLLSGDAWLHSDPESSSSSPNPDVGVTVTGPAWIGLSTREFVGIFGGGRGVALMRRRDPFLGNVFRRPSKHESCSCTASTCDHDSSARGRAGNTIQAVQDAGKNCPITI